MITFLVYFMERFSRLILYNRLRFLAFSSIKSPESVIIDSCHSGITDQNTFPRNSVSSNKLFCFNHSSFDVITFIEKDFENVLQVLINS